jgi:hypothetical protein
MSKCEDCKYGVIQLTNYNDWKSKKISRLDFDRVAVECAGRCFPCIHNGITGRKARIYKRLFANRVMQYLTPAVAFQSADLFEEDTTSKEVPYHLRHERGSQ